MFKTLGTLLNRKTPTEEEISKISSYVMINWLSNNKDTVIPANYININYNIPITNQYKFLDDYFELTGIKNKISYIKYNKTNKLQNEEIINNIERYYNVNKSDAIKYYNLMDKKERVAMKNMYKEGTEGKK